MSSNGMNISTKPAQFGVSNDVGQLS